MPEEAEPSSFIVAGSAERVRGLVLLCLECLDGNVHRQAVGHAHTQFRRAEDVLLEDRDGLDVIEVLSHVYPALLKKLMTPDAFLPALTESRIAVMCLHCLLRDR